MIIITDDDGDCNKKEEGDDDQDDRDGSGDFDWGMISSYSRKTFFIHAALITHHHSNLLRQRNQRVSHTLGPSHGFVQLNYDPCSKGNRPCIPKRQSKLASRQLSGISII